MSLSEAEELNSQIHERQKELITHTMGQSMAYNNLIMVGGFAGFFGLWSLTKEYISIGQVFWSALFISISIMFFVFFEIYKMIVNGIIFHRIQEAVDNPPRFIELMEVHRQKTGEMMRLFGKIWRVVLVVAVGSGFFAGTIMVYSFASGLYRLYLAG